MGGVAVARRGGRSSPHSLQHHNFGLSVAVYSTPWEITFWQATLQPCRPSLPPGLALARARPTDSELRQSLSYTSSCTCTGMWHANAKT